MGIKRVMQIILWNIETGYNHIYDCDIKGFFEKKKAGNTIHPTEFVKCCTPNE